MDWRGLRKARGPCPAEGEVLGPSRQSDERARPQVIVPNLHWHYTGVTATARNLTPRIAIALPTAWIGPFRPAGVSQIGILDLLLHMRRSGHPALWHARRNNEMLVGLLLKWSGCRLRLVFTSAAQRRHKWFTNLLIGQMDDVIAPTPAAASYVRRPTRLIPHAVDTVLYSPPGDREAASEEAYSPGHLVIGCFGRVRYQKGTDVFVDAMCRVLPRHPEASAIVIGPITKDQEAFANELVEKVRAAGLSNRISILGEIPLEEVIAWYRRITIFAFTSRVEGFGLTLLEAMASGCATIATPTGAAELLIEENVNGLIVPPGDPEAMEAAIDRLLNSPSLVAKLGSNARERVASEFSIDNEANALVRCYREILAER